MYPDTLDEVLGLAMTRSVIVECTTVERAKTLRLRCYALRRKYAKRGEYKFYIIEFRIVGTALRLKPNAMLLAKRQQDLRRDLFHALPPDKREKYRALCLPKSEEKVPE